MGKFERHQRIIAHAAKDPSHPLALANWLALAAMGEVSLATEPLASLYLQLPSMTWALQFGAVGLAEASALHSSTSAVIRGGLARPKRRPGSPIPTKPSSVSRQKR